MKGQIIENLEDALDKVVCCNDGDTRILTKIEPKFLHYKVPIGRKDGPTYWMQLGGTYRSQAEPMFMGGEIVDELLEGHLVL